jgi:lysine 2,3-aminomutase
LDTDAVTARTLTMPEQLAQAGLVSMSDLATLDTVSARYAVALPPALAGLIDRSDPNDPIARQFVPTMAELETTADERADPIGDNVHAPVPGIVHRHRDRVLFKIVAACPVYCRFCFRREMVGPGGETALSRDAFETALAYIAAHPEIWEVILTGGDPFILSARRVADVTARLAAIPHVKIIRWHTRVPVADPARVTDDFVRALKTDGVTTVVAIHANHPRELSPEACKAIARLADAGIPLLSQSVLLKGVNDCVETLEALMRAFVETRIKPYYLHHPDLAPGTSHFRVSVADGLALMRALKIRLSGLALPSYVLDIPGGYGKVPLDSANAEEIAPGRYRIRDADGRWHSYLSRC